MVVGVTVIIVAAVIVSIWVIIELKRMRHKIFAIFLIALILFGYLSFMFVIRNQHTDLKTVSGLMTAGKTYLSWLTSVFVNMKSVTSYAIKQNWGFDNALTNSSQNLSNTTKR